MVNGLTQMFGINERNIMPICWKMLSGTYTKKNAKMNVKNLLKLNMIIYQLNGLKAIFTKWFLKRFFSWESKLNCLLFSFYCFFVSS